MAGNTDKPKPAQRPLSKPQGAKTGRVNEDNMENQDDDDIDLDVYGGNVGQEDDGEGDVESHNLGADDEVVDLDDLDTEPLSDDDDAVDGMSVSADDDIDGEGTEDVPDLVAQLQDLAAKLSSAAGVEDDLGDDFGDEDGDLDFDGESGAEDDDLGDSDSGPALIGDEGDDDDEDDEDDLQEESEPGGWVPKNKAKHDQLHTGTETSKTSLPNGKGATGTENRPDSDKAIKDTTAASQGGKKATPPGKSGGKGNGASNGDNWGGTAKTEPIDKVMTKALESLDIDLAKESAGFAQLGGFLSEENKAKGRKLFENAVSKRLGKMATAIDRHYRTVFSEEVAEMQVGLVEKIDEYLDYVVGNYIEDNALAIDEGLKVEISESFMTGMRGLFEAHNIVVPKAKVDLVDTLQDQLAEQESKEKALFAKAVKLRKENVVLRRAATVTALSEDLSALNGTKLAKFAESVEYRNQKQFAEDLSIVKQTHFGKQARPTPTAEFEALAEHTVNQPHMNDRIAGYAKVVNTISRKK